MEVEEGNKAESLMHGIHTVEQAKHAGMATKLRDIKTPCPETKPILHGSTRVFLA
jgi:hypothetical protein